MLFAPTTKRLPNLLYEHYQRGAVMHCPRQQQQQQQQQQPQQQQQHAANGGLEANAAGGGARHNAREAFARIYKREQDGKGASAIDTASRVPCEIVEIMMKLDSKIVSYLAGDSVSQSDEQLALQCLQTASSPLDHLVGKMAKERGDVLAPSQHDHQQQQHATSLQNALGAATGKVNGLKVHLEALTLQPEGTKRMELLQNEMRPIFTVECTLPYELISRVPRYDMYHVMQFESEKFHSLTQCTRFGEEIYRQIELNVAGEEEEEGEPEMEQDGVVTITVWWREPGTCLNEMLGMGRLHLRDMCNDSLLEQCKCIPIVKRNVHLASLYMKVSLQSAAPAAGRPADSAEAVAAAMAAVGDSNNNNKQCDSLDDNRSALVNGSGCGSGAGDGQQQQQQQQQLRATQGGKASADGRPGAAAAASSNNNVTSNNNNNVHIQTGDFANETTKVRLLKGFIAVSDVRGLKGIMPTSASSSSAAGPHTHTQDYDLVLTCQRFWLEEMLAITAAQEDTGTRFDYQEQFAVINDEKFLKRAEKQFLSLELWQRRKDSAAAPPAGAPPPPKYLCLGIATLPLHQFFIAYRDSAITNHLCKGKLPVISFDAWARITAPPPAATASSAPPPAVAGELKCLLAIGSEEQVAQLKLAKGWPALTPAPANRLDSKALLDLMNCRKQLLPPPPTPSASPAVAGKRPTTASAAAHQHHHHQQLMNDMMQQLMHPPGGGPPQLAGDRKSFKFVLHVQQARGLPLNSGCYMGLERAGTRKSAAAKRFHANHIEPFTANEPPSTYVTFQADEANGPSYKSHEGDVYATPVEPKSCQPVWNKVFRVAASRELLTQARKPFVLKVWNKANTPTTRANPQAKPSPSPCEDAILGCASLDLTPLRHSVGPLSDWFNVADSSGRVTGQLLVTCQGLYVEAASSKSCPMRPLLSSLAVGAGEAATAVGGGALGPEQALLEQLAEGGGGPVSAAYGSVGQAIKRKFNELDEISQRLRFRLGDAMGQQLPETASFDMSSLDNWRSLEEVLHTDEFQLNDDFEHDIATPPPVEELGDGDDGEEEEVEEEDNVLEEGRGRPEDGQQPGK